MDRSTGFVILDPLTRTRRIGAETVVYQLSVSGRSKAWRAAFQKGGPAFDEIRA